MADGGIGEAALISAAIGGGMSAAQGRDPLQGMIMGGLLGGAGAGLGLGSGAVGVDAVAGEAVAADTLAMAQQQAAMNAAQSVEASQLAGINSLPGAQSSLVSRGGVDVLNGAGGATNNLAGQSYINQTAGNNAALYTDAPATGFGGPGTFDIVSPSAGQAITAAGPSATPSFLDKAASYLPESTAGKIALGGGLGLAGLMAQERNKYGVPPVEKYTGPLSKFRYDPSNYRPDIPAPPVNPYRAQYAAGGPVEQMSNQAAMGANTMYPMANMSTSSFATPYQSPVSTNMLAPTSDSGVTMGGEPNMQGTRLAAGGQVPRYGGGGFLNDVFGDAAQLVGDAVSGVGQFVENAGEGRIGLNKPDRGGYQAEDYQNPYSLSNYRSSDVSQNVYNPQQYAAGGIASLGSYSDGGRMLKGPGDGMSDSIPARIGSKQEARLADGEFVVPADVVSHLGNGSTDAGAKQLYSMMDKVRTARTGRKSQGRQIKPHRYMPA
jgi:hypothetical protein